MDKRYDVRVPLQLTSSVNFVSSIIESKDGVQTNAQVENLSAAGLLIRSTRPINAGEMVNCTLIHLSSGHGLSFEAEARWTRYLPSAEPIYRIGMSVRDFRSGNREMWEELRLSCLEKVEAIDLLDQSTALVDSEGKISNATSGPALALVQIEKKFRPAWLISSFNYQDQKFEKWSPDFVSRIAHLQHVERHAKLNDVWNALVNSGAGMVVVWDNETPLGVVSLRSCARLYAEQQSLNAFRQAKATEMEKAIAAHELRGPLGLVKSTLGMLDDGTVTLVDLKNAGLMEGMLKKCDQGLEIVERYLGQARSRGQVAKQTQVNLSAIAADIISEFKRACDQKRIDVELLGENDNISFVGVELEVYQILRNIVSNAIKYSHPGSKIQLSVQIVGGNVQLTVIDHGIGIAPEQLSRLFSAFGVCGNQPTSGETQSGIGLYLTKQLVENNQGSIEIKSGTGEGTSVTLTFPQCP